MQGLAYTLWDKPILVYQGFLGRNPGQTVYDNMAQSDIINKLLCLGTGYLPKALLNDTR